MNNGSRINRYTLGIIAAFALLAGCGGSQVAPTGGAITGAPSASRAAHGKSWMLPEATDENLLYVSVFHSIEVFSYPQLQNVGELSGFNFLEGLCTDGSGNIYAVDQGNQDIVGYSHGASTPFVSLDDSGNWPNGCAVDPKSRNLAVVGGAYEIAPGNVAIYPNATGSPTMYYPSGPLAWCTYDNEGNLFSTPLYDGYQSGVWLVELPRGSSTFTGIRVDQTGGPGGAVQWDGKFLAVGDPRWGDKQGPTTVYRVRTLGSSSEIVKTIELKNMAEAPAKGASSRYSTEKSSHQRILSEILGFGTIREAAIQLDTSASVRAFLMA